MLDLESRQEILGITVYQDTDRPSQYYYLPASPHITRDPSGPLFDLFAYRKGGLADQTETGGFLNMTVDIGLGGLASQITSKLQDLTGRDDITLASVPYTRGSAHIIALGEDSSALTAAGAAETTASGSPLVAPGPRFIQNILGSSSPSLDGDNRAIFSLSLSEDGAAFFLGALKGAPDARIVGVIYELEYVGLLPAYDLEIEIDFKSSYDYVHSLFTANTLFFKAEVDNVVESLKREQHIKIKETARTLDLSTPQAVQARQAHIDQVVRDLATGALFQPALVPGQPRASDNLVTATDWSTTVANMSSQPGTATAPGAAGQPSQQSSQVLAAAAQAPSAGVVAAQGVAMRNSVSADGSPVTAGAASAPGSTSGTGATTGAGGAATPGAGGAPTSTGSTTAGAATPGAGAQGAGTAGGHTAGTGAATGSGSGTAGSGTTGGSTPAGGATGTPAASGQATTAADVWNRLGRPQAAYALRTLSQEEQRTVTYSLTQVTAQKQTVAPQSFIQFLANMDELHARVHDVDLNDPFFQRININVNAADVAFDADGIEQVTVALRYGTRPDGTSPKDTAQAILRKSTDSTDVTFFADAAVTLGYEYQLTVDYRSDFGIGVKTPRVEGPWTPSEARSLAVHPGWLGQVLPLEVELAPNVGVDVSEIQAVVRYSRPDHAVDESRLLHLTGTSRSQELPVRLVADGDAVQIVPTVYYADGGTEQLATITVPDPVAGQPTSTCVIGVPRGDFLSGDMVMVDALGELQSCIVDTEVSQHGSIVDSRSTELTQAGARKTYSIRLPDRTVPPTLRYKQRRLFRDGGLEDGDWSVATDTSLVVGIPAEGVGSVAVTYIGPAPSQLGLAAIQVDLEYRDPAGDEQFHQTTSLLIDDHPVSWTQDWRFRLVHRDQRSYTWTLTLLHADGTTTVGPVTADQRPRLILRIPQA